MKNLMVQMLENKVALLEDDLWSVHQYLTDKGVPKISADGKTFSIVGRIIWMEKHMMKDFSQTETELMRS